MDRIIKFRAWGEASKKMIHPDNELTSGEILDRAMNVMQFTGLLDRNGKEIYEGDIIVHRYPTGLNSAAYEVKSIWEFAQIQTRFLSDKQLEVLGNLYENPNLLT